MKTRLESDRFVPCTITLRIETHDELKALYAAVHSQDEMDDLATVINDFAKDQKLSL